ncbi:MAG: hypothetical protein J6I50_03600 [Clostridia bacterium]|nr:hypothetical protein [Clostridia bacterium]
MKKVFILLTVSALSAAALSSCGNNDAMYQYDLNNYVTLGNYKGIEVSVAEIKENMESQHDSILNQNKYDVDTGAAAEDGNKITYSLTAQVDGAAVESLAKTDAVFIVGSSTTDYEALTEAMSGITAGETKEITVKLPDDYTDAALAGKDAVLTLNVASVTTSVTPDTLTDDMVKTATKEKYTTIADFDEYLYSNFKQTLVWDKVIADTKFSSYPKKEAESYYNNSLASYQSTAAQYGVTLESLVSLYGMTTDTFYNTIAQQAVNQVYQDMTMLSIAEKENLVPDDAKLDEVAAELAESYGYENVDALKKDVTKEALTQSATFDMVLDFLEANAVEVE